MIETKKHWAVKTEGSVFIAETATEPAPPEEVAMADYVQVANNCVPAAEYAKLQSEEWLKAYTKAREAHIIKLQWEKSKAFWEIYGGSPEKLMQSMGIDYGAEMYMMQKEVPADDTHRRRKELDKYAQAAAEYVRNMANSEYRNKLLDADPGTGVAEYRNIRPKHPMVGILATQKSDKSTKDVADAEALATYVPSREMTFTVLKARAPFSGERLTEADAKKAIGEMLGLMPNPSGTWEVLLDRLRDRFRACERAEDELNRTQCRLRAEQQRANRAADQLGDERVIFHDAREHLTAAITQLTEENQRLKKQLKK